jgi:glycosyltransferase involved in cell wall biosynthesis
MKIIMAHPTGNNNVRAVISALKNASMLKEFNTTIAFNKSAYWMKLLPANIQNQLLRRHYDLEPNFLKTYPVRELARMVFPKIGLKCHVNKETSWASIDSVYRNLDANVSNNLNLYSKIDLLTAVYAYEDGALNTFRRAKSLGLICIYDLPIAYWETAKKLLHEEAERLPAWAESLAGGISDSTEKCDRKVMEMEMADIIVTPGVFVADSLPTWTKGKHVIISPFGSPSANGNDIHPNRNVKSSKLRVLFVGSMTQRKGLGDLFEAIKLLNNPLIELVVMGSLISSMEFYRGQLSTFTYMKNRPHHQVLELMRSCDVFCLPSIVEGRALVMQEAMSQGLPLIITANTGGEDLIIEGETGFLVPIRSPDSIAAKLQWFLTNPSHVKAMGKKAQEHAVNFTWKGYGDTIVSSLLNYNKKSINY